jgi:transcriptional regulator with XRE-family HTH domain
MITGAQIRAARAVLRWTSEDLARQSGVAVRTIKRMETVDGVPPGRATTLQDIQAALETAGIEFLGSPADRLGIRFVVTKRDDE